MQVIDSVLHGALRQPPDDGAFCFMSLRDPVDHYVSLYRFGCSGKGGMFKRQRAAGRAEHLYGRGPDGFADWVDFMTDPSNASMIDPRYARASPQMYGLMTFRYLYLAIPGLLKLGRGLASREDLRRLFAAHSCVSTYVRKENLNADLLALSRSHLRPFIKNVTQCEEFLRDPERVNVTEAPPISTVAPDVIARIRKREWFVYETFGYDAT